MKNGGRMMTEGPRQRNARVAVQKTAAAALRMLHLTPKLMSQQRWGRYFQTNQLLEYL